MRSLIGKQKPLMVRDVTNVIVVWLCLIGKKKINDLWPLLLQGLFFYFKLFFT
jgi:hypothetical protein